MWSKITTDLRIWRRAFFPGWIKANRGEHPTNRWWRGKITKNFYWLMDWWMQPAWIILANADVSDLKLNWFRKSKLGSVSFIHQWEDHFARSQRKGAILSLFRCNLEWYRLDKNHQWTVQFDAFPCLLKTMARHLVFSSNRNNGGHPW